MLWNQIIKHLISVGAIIGLVGWLAKLFLSKFAESRVEKYKAILLKETEEFKSKLNLDVEKFRNQLNISTIEHQIRYSKLYEERGKVTKEIYSLLLKLEHSLSTLTTLFQGPEWINDVKREEEAIESIKNLGKKLEENSIFFSEDLCNKIESIIDNSQNVVFEMRLARQGEHRIKSNIERNLSREDLIEPTKKWFELDNKVKNDIRAARLSLTEEFRKLIGVK